MYKIASFGRFLPTLDKNEGRAYWRDVHGPLGAAVPGVLRYTQNHVVGPVPDPSHPSDAGIPFDGYACLWFEDHAAFEAARTTPEWQALGEDGKKLFDETATISSPVDERVMKEGDLTPFKEVAVTMFKPGMPKKEASDYWTNVHGPLGIELAPDFGRYVQNHAIQPTDGGPQPPFDGFAEHWYDDEAAFFRVVTSPDWKRVVDDGYLVFDMETMWQALVDEVVIKG
jgi:uncharacterized protein (TIGR02118 family)